MPPTTPRTYRVALLGDGIGASLTPPMHEREAASLGLEYTYELFDIADGTLDRGQLQAFVTGLRAAGFAGLNVTHPYKRLALELADDVSLDAELIGAANLLVLGEDAITGHNTDWSGFGWALDRALGAIPPGPVLQIGSGGAGAATSYSLLSRGVEQLFVLDRSVETAQALVERYGRAFPGSRLTTLDSFDAVPWASLTGVVHATPTGMAQHPGRAFDPGRLDRGAWLAEVVYRPTRTDLVASAQELGLRVVDGTGMAAGQAIDTLRVLTGLEPDATRVVSHLHDLLVQEGQPAVPATSSGVSTVAG